MNDTSITTSATTVSSSSASSLNTTTSIRKERLLVLYGSQTGNSEQVANDFCNQVSTRLSLDVLQKAAGSLSVSSSTTNIIIEPICMQLDDFLEIERCQWTQFFIIIVSSYGVGQAPMGSIRFRELSDYWLSSKANNSINNMEKLLNGTYCAMCGLGDSKYTTYFNNPRIIDTALQYVGCQRIGTLGKADASGTGSNKQFTIIEQWMDTIWNDLAHAIVSKPQLTYDQLQSIQTNTMKICYQINPDLQQNNNNDTTKSKRSMKKTKNSISNGQKKLSSNNSLSLLFSSENLFYFGIIIGVIVAIWYKLK